MDTQLQNAWGNQSKFTPQELAALGRNGDSIVAHMTPGEIAVPPQVQTPQLMSALHQAFSKAGVSPAHFTAGSPASSINPNTGQPEYSFWSSFAPIALGLAGNLVAPGIGTALGSTMSGAALGAIGSGLGTTLGGYLGGQRGLNPLLMGGAAGLGSYGLNSLFNSDSLQAAKAATSTPDLAASNADSVTGQMAKDLGKPTLGGLDLSKMTYAGGDAAAGAAGDSGNLMASLSPNPSGLLNLYGNLNGNQNLGGVAGGALGGMAANALLQPQPAVSPQDTNNRLTGGSFNQPYTRPTQNYQQLLGQDKYTGPTANFNGYNPATNAPMAWNFYQPQPAANAVM